VKKRNFLLSVVVTFSLVTTASNLAIAESSVDDVKEIVDPTTEKVVTEKPKVVEHSEKAKKLMETQGNEKVKIDKIVEEAYGNYEEFEKETVIYMTDDAILYIGFKEDTEKMKLFKQKTAEKIKSEKVKFTKVNFSKQDLRNLNTKLWEYIDQSESILTENQGIMTAIDDINQKLILELQSISSKDEDELKKQFGNILEIKIISDKQLPQPEIARERDWTKLGGGIRLHDAGGGYCSSTAIGKKDTRYFLITAGHCLDGDDSSVYQDTYRVGFDHSSRQYEGIDAGIIWLNDPNRDSNTLSSGRYATNYFYEYAEDNDDYDARIPGYSSPFVGQYVCKSGITTDTTCGQVENTDTYYNDTTDAYGNQQSFRINGHYINYYYNYSDPGDSGGITYEPNQNKILGIHVAGNDNTGQGWATKITDVINAYSSSGNPFSIYTSSTNIKVSN
jgi:hypothetical protein